VTLIPGVYQAEVRKHTWGYSQSGTPFLSVDLLIFTDFGEEAMNGRIYFSAKSMGIGRQNLKALGFDPDTQEVEEVGDSISFIGNQCTIELQEQEYNGRTELKVARWGTVKPPDKEALRKLGADLKAAKTRKKTSDGPELPGFGGPPASKPAVPPPAKANGPKPLNTMTPAEVKAEAAADDDGSIPF
jgi:hypothetical protein